MKKLMSAVIFAALSAAAFGQQVSVIIPQFALVGGATSVERDTITRYFMGDLANTKMFRVLDRGNIDKRIDEMKFQQSDWSDKSKTAELMKGINAEYVIVGSIVKRNDGLAVDAMLEDLNTFEIIGTARVRMTKADDAFDVMESFVAALVKNVGGSSGTASAPITRRSAVPEGFVLIEGGTFTMGSPVSEVDRGSDETQHQVTVSSFYMGKYEVTQAEYTAVMGTNPSNFKGDTLPVERVSWYDAIEYCNKRSEKEGLRPAYSIDKSRFDPNNYADTEDDSIRWIVTVNKNANGYRLPTEAEWEYACRAGLTTPFNTGSNITTSQANYDGNYPYNKNAKGTYRETTTAVGSFAPNRWGLYDMHGNVWEWCWDWYGSYASGAVADPVGISSGLYRVRRGGGWLNVARLLRSAYRFNAAPSGRGSSLGFRLVRPSL